MSRGFLVRTRTVDCVCWKIEASDRRLPEAWFFLVQFAPGQIDGVISDSSGGVVPGVTVTAVEQQTGISRATISGPDGRYTFPALRPTIYEIRAVLTGFRTIRRTGIELSAYQNLTVNVALKLGELSETISVAGDAAQVDVTSATISEVVDHARIVELPLTGAMRRN